jgi:signal transduction histidine kinase
MNEPNASPGPQRDPPPVADGHPRTRWLGLLVGALGGALDTVVTLALGIRFEMSGVDVTLVVLGGYALTFAALGYLFGLVLEARRRDRAAAALIREQMEAVDATRARLAESEKLAALGQLGAMIAHEVRNALAVIRSSAQSLTETLSGQDGESRQSCSFIIAEIDRLGSVVSSLLAFARPLRVAPRPVDVPRLFDQAQLLARKELEMRRIRLVRNETAPLPPVEVDSDLVVQVLLDLLSNAAQAAPPGSEVVLDAHPRGGEVEIGVADRGPGVPAELRARIFEPFFTTREKGTGLGLAVARQIVEAHRGRIDVFERDGGGAWFRIALPAAPAASGAA